MQLYVFIAKYFLQNFSVWNLLWLRIKSCEAYLITRSLYVLLQFLHEAELSLAHHHQFIIVVIIIMSATGFAHALIIRLHFSSCEKKLVTESELFKMVEHTRDRKLWTRKILNSITLPRDNFQSIFRNFTKKSLTCHGVDHIYPGLEDLLLLIVVERSDVRVYNCFILGAVNTLWTNSWSSHHL